MNQINEEEFFKLLVNKIPALRENINDWEYDESFFKMERFADYTKEQIKSENIMELRKCFDFLESKIDTLNSLLINALNVSYCESLLLGGLGDKIEQVIALMGPKLIAIYKDYEKYYNELRKNK